MTKLLILALVALTATAYNTDFLSQELTEEELWSIRPDCASCEGKWWTMLCTKFCNKPEVEDFGKTRKGKLRKCFKECDAFEDDDELLRCRIDCRQKYSRKSRGRLEVEDLKIDLQKALKFGRKVYDIVKIAYQKGKPVFCNNVCPNVSNENVLKACSIVCSLEDEEYRFGFGGAIKHGRKAFDTFRPKIHFRH